MRTDVGSYGEYCIFKLLKSYESQGAKFLFNVYLPKGENETTEIDVLMICSQGIYVFESKITAVGFSAMKNTKCGLKPCRKVKADRLKKKNF